MSRRTRGLGFEQSTIPPQLIGNPLNIYPFLSGDNYRLHTSQKGLPGIKDSERTASSSLRRGVQVAIKYHKLTP